MIRKFISREKLQEMGEKYLLHVPHSLSKNQIRIDRDGLDIIEKSLGQNYHTGWRSIENYSEQMYKNDLNAHLIKRLESDRRRIIPWLNKAKQIKNSNILEIGCGTGSSTVALAEQKAMVTAIDIDEGALEVAKKRCQVYSLKVDFRMNNASEIHNIFPKSQFDFILFFACLEHMTYDERLISLKNTWAMLQPGGLLVIIETPNRLWYFDRHTSWLPFFDWLPDELAFKYSCFSKRNNFGELYRELNSNSKEHFLRRGRGASFHEFSIAIRPAEDLNVINSLSTFHRILYPFSISALDRKYEAILQHICPNIHKGFFSRSLNLIIKKD